MNDDIRRADIRLRKDMYRKPFYDLYVDGKYENSYIDIKKAEEKLKEYMKKIESGD